MLFPNWKGAGSDRATGSPEKESRIYHVLFALKVVVLLLLATSNGVNGASFEDPLIIIRNDSAALKNDMTVGRFGTGRLYFDDPMDLVVDEDENIYILDAGNYRIQVMDEDGRHESTWGNRGSSEGLFDEPVALAIDREDEALYVLDQEQYLVHKFDLEGSFILSFGKEGSRKGRFEEPVDLTVDSLGYIYVLDRERKKVLKYHKSGAFVDEWGSARGRREDAFLDPVSIVSTDEHLGYIYVLDAGKGAILKFERDGKYEGSVSLVPEVFTDGAQLVRIESDEDGNIFVLEAMHLKLLKLEGSTCGVYGLAGETLNMDKPSGLAIDEEGRVYVSDLKRNRIFRLLPELE